MHTDSGYGWCHSWQCVADWTWGQNANNVATLLGAIATFAAAFLALRFSQNETRRRMADDDARARIAAAASIAKVRDVRDSLAAIAGLCLQASVTEGTDGILGGLFNATGRWDVIPRVDAATLLLLAPLPNDAAVRLSRAFGVIEFLQRQRPLMQAYIGPLRRVEAENFTAPLWAALQSAVEDLNAATEVLERATG